MTPFRVHTSFWKSIRRIGVALVSLLAVTVVALWIFQERLVFLPPAVPVRQGRNAMRVEYTASDGQRLFAFLITPAGRTPPFEHLVVAFHGNGDLADSWVDWGHAIADRFAWPVLLAEYRGYGGLAGRPTYQGLMHDAAAALDFAHNTLGVGPSGVALFGHSLGSGVATQLATDHDVRAVILEAPMTSIDDEGRRDFGPPIGWVVPLISRIPFAPLARVAQIGAPVWVAIGGRDDVAPPDMGRRVFAAARHKGELLVVDNAGHGTIGDLGGERYWRWLGRALSNP